MRRPRTFAVPLALVLALAAVVVTADPVAQLATPSEQLRTPKPLAFAEPLSEGPVYIVPVHGMIDNMLARYIDRALSEAEAADASLVVLHVDTFGGLVAAADLIRKRLLNATVPTVAFVDKNAASAGALISYSADRIVMVPGSSIGAATVVDGVEGEAAPDKYQSYMRGLMRATAEARERDPRIAEAMVDQNLEIEGVSPAGQVLTLSYREALDLGVADAILASQTEVIEAFGQSRAEIVTHRETRTERVLRFFGSPMVQSILILMMLGGLYFELQTPGVGFAGTMAAIGAAAFFAPHYMLGLVDSWEFVLFIMGVGLILAEVFVLPGFGVAGISGAILVVFALGASMIGNVGFQFPSGPAVSSAIGTMAVTLVLLVALIFSLSRYLPHSERFNALVLAPDLSSATGYTSAETVDSLVGSVGQTLTPLRPSGTAIIGDERVDVIAASEYIPAGAPVRVTRVRGSRVEVRTYEPVADDALKSSST
jgi:membrane-bound serine protease (ClpP class)